MRYLYLTVFITAIFTCVLCLSTLGNEVLYNYNKARISTIKDRKRKLKRFYIRVAKRLLKITVILIWIAYETYVKSKRPNAYAMGSWLFNINIVENKEAIILSLMGIVIAVVLCISKFSRDRVIETISIEKRAAMKKRVKAWDETKMTTEVKEMLCNNDGDNTTS